MHNVRNRMFTLLRGFCDVLIDHQLHTHDHWDGGIGCESCRILHGRCGDAIFPLYYMFFQTEDTKYAEAAQKLVNYMKRTQLRDGSFLNETSAEWKGTTVFTAIALSHTYDLLQKQKRPEWAGDLIDMIEKATRWVKWAFGKENIVTTINYYFSAALQLEWASRILGQPELSVIGNRLIDKYVMGQLNLDGFLLGEEGQPHGNVDMGYNLDLSLGFLAEYAILQDNPQMKRMIMNSLKKHLYFIYPDGSVDNSTGCRSYKWTLYGSKTCHGIQMVLALLADEDPAFERALELTTEYLYQQCEDTGFQLGYGPHHKQLFDSTCTHMAFSRADGLACALLYGKEHVDKHGRIPAETIFGVKFFPSIQVMLVRTKHMMATVSGCFASNVPTGGAIAYLWHDRLGPVQIGSSTKYERFEEINMPEFPYPYAQPITPRIELQQTGKMYSNLFEYSAGFSLDSSSDNMTLTCTGRFRDKDHESRYGCGSTYSIAYSFGDDWLEKKYHFTIQHPCDRLSIVEPVVCSVDSYQIKEQEKFIISNGKGSIVVSGGGEGHSFFPLDDMAASVFPAITAKPFVWSMEQVEPGDYVCEFRIHLKEIQC